MKEIRIILADDHQLVLDGMRSMLQALEGFSIVAEARNGLEVLEAARKMGMNLSQTVDALLADEVKRRYWEQWNERNKDAVAEYNARIAKYGLPLEKYRTF